LSAEAANTEASPDCSTTAEDIAVHSAEDTTLDEETSSSPSPSSEKKKPKNKLRVVLSDSSNNYYIPTLEAKQPVEEIPRCGHPIHPAYAEEYDESQCPMCLYLDIRSRQSKLDTYIASKSGVQIWRDRNQDPPIPESLKDHPRFASTVRGGSLKHPKDEVFDKYGLEISHRHNKKRLANLDMDLEGWAMEEKRWQKKHPDGYAAIHEIEKTELRKSSATFTLAYFRQASERGDFLHVEKTAQKAVRKRGRDWEIAADPTYPED
jgi:hypothetical protein